MNKIRRHHTKSRDLIRIATCLHKSILEHARTNAFSGASLDKLHVTLLESAIASSEDFLLSWLGAVCRSAAQHTVYA